MGTHPVHGAAIGKVNIMINFGGIALIPLGRGGGRWGEQRIFHISTSLLRSEVCPSCSCIAEAFMFQRQLLILVTLPFPFRCSGLKAPGAPGDVDMSGGCSELPAHVLEVTHGRDSLEEG